MACKAIWKDQKSFILVRVFYTFLFRVDNNNDLEGKEDTLKWM